MEKRFGKVYRQSLEVGLEVQIKQQRSIWSSKTMFAQMIAVDVLVANLWMGFLLWDPKER
jgi:hypothetical protein